MSSAQTPSKKELILQTASNLFMQNGFQAVSMDQIAATAPVSKPTLYAHFKDKRELFGAVINLRCELALPPIQAVISEGAGPDKSLTAFASQFIDLLLSLQSLQFYRVIIGESESFPDMARLFFETGPRKMHELLRDYLAKLDADGILKVEDPAIAADIFLGMIKGRMHLKCLLGLEKNVPQSERDYLAKHAVCIFLNGQRPG